MTGTLRNDRIARILIGAVLAFLAAPDSATAQNLLSPSYAVVIGITNYQRPQFWPKLDTAEPDAKAIQALFERQGFVVTPLLGSQAKRDVIISTLRTLARKIDADRATAARVVVYFSGHGTTETVAGTDYGYLVPWDATNDNVSYVSMDDLRDVSERLQTARHQLFLLDSCFGGLLVLRGPPPGINTDQPGYLQDAIKRKAVEVLTAGGKDQRVVSNGPNGHSPFTGALLEALDQGLADTTRNGAITFTQLAGYVIPRGSTRYSTPGQGTLPGHGLGEFLFRSPLAPNVVATNRPTVPSPTPVFKSPADVSPVPIVTINPTPIPGADIGQVPIVTIDPTSVPRAPLDIGPEPSDPLAALDWSLCSQGNARACFDLGRQYQDGKAGLTKDLKRAVALFKKACAGGNSAGCAVLIQEPQAALARNKALNDSFKAGIQAESSRNWNTAIESFRRASDLDPSQHLVWAHLADAYTALNRLPESESSYERAVALKPDDASYRNNYALALARDKKFDAARQQLEEAARLDPVQAARYFYNLGAVLVNTGEMEPAGAAFKKAIDADPNYAEAYYQYGIYLVGKESVDAAGRITPPAGTRDALESYLRLAPRGQNAEAARSMLASLGR